LREAWQKLATDEYVAVAALDRQLDAPSYDRPTRGLPAVVVDGAANLICGARLLGRPAEFRPLTRLVRATVAIVLIDLHTDTLPIGRSPSVSERLVNCGLVESVDADNLVARPLAAHDRDPGGRDPGPAGDQATQRAIRAPVDCRRAHAYAQHTVANADQLVGACARLETNADPRTGHRIQ
jgi:hypothetical protein